MNCRENKYILLALPHGGGGLGADLVRGENVQVTRRKHQVLKKYLGNATILSDDTANILGEAG